jgi:hypothetical protein
VHESVQPTGGGGDSGGFRRSYADALRSAHYPLDTWFGLGSDRRVAGFDEQLPVSVRVDGSHNGLDTRCDDGANRLIRITGDLAYLAQIIQSGWAAVSARLLPSTDLPLLPYRMVGGRATVQREYLLHRVRFPE